MERKGHKQDCGQREVKSREYRLLLDAVEARTQMVPHASRKQCSLADTVQGTPGSDF